MAVASTAALSSSAEAATFEVTSTADAGPGTLRNAVAAANAAPADDSIVFASTLSGNTIGLTSGEIDIYVGPGYGDLDIQGPGANQLAVSGSDLSGIFFAYSPGPYGELAIDGLTLRDANGAGKYSAITSNVDTLSVSDSVLTENESYGYGGALLQFGGGAHLDNVTITDNTAGVMGGGAAIFSYDRSSVVDSTISGNEVTGICACPDPTFGGGLALFQYPGERSKIERTTISENRVQQAGAGYATYGGGLALLGGVYVGETELTGNYAGGPGAGGIAAFGKYNVGPEIADATIAGNTSVGGAGGVEAYGATRIARSTISGNEGTVGGVAAYDYACGCGPLTPDEALILSNSTVSGNTAVGSSTTPGYRTGYGGGVYLHGQVGGTIRNSTIVDNSAETGGGGVLSYAGDAYAVETREISSTIIAGNTAGGAPDDLGTDGAGGVGFSLGFSLIETPGSADLVSDPAGSNIFGTDPELGPLTDNGGPTLTHKPTPGSPVIDAGTANGLAVDQRGEPRSGERPPNNADDGTDIGSVELQGDVAPPTTTITSGPAEGETVLSDTVTFGFKADEAGSSFECKLDAGAWSPCSSPKTYNSLSSGDHTFSVRATDEAGNTGPAASRTFTVVLADCNGTPATIVATPGEVTIGTPERDVIVGTDGDDQIKGLGGDDQICALGGDDLVLGGEGDDEISGDTGDDQIGGGGGADGLYGSGGADLLVGDVGDDYLFGANGDDTLRGRDGTDELLGRNGSDDLRGNAGADELAGGADDDLVRGDADDDLIKGNGGSDELRGAAGDDEIRGAGKPDELFGGKGDDYLNGGKGRNSCNGGSGVNELVNCD